MKLRGLKEKKQHNSTLVSFTAGQEGSSLRLYSKEKRLRSHSSSDSFTLDFYFLVSYFTQGVQSAGGSAV